jgi:hypothetical protein
LLQLPGSAGSTGKMRGHLANGGWVSMNVLACRSRYCGHCRNCDTSRLPSVNAGMKAVEDKREITLEREHARIQTEFDLYRQRILLRMEAEAEKADKIEAQSVHVAYFFFLLSASLLASVYCGGILRRYTAAVYCGGRSILRRSDSPPPLASLCLAPVV